MCICLCFCVYMYICVCACMCVRACMFALCVCIRACCCMSVCAQTVRYDAYSCCKSDGAPSKLSRLTTFRLPKPWLNRSAAPSRKPRLLKTWRTEAAFVESATEHSIRILYTVKCIVASLDVFRRFCKENRQLASRHSSNLCNGI